MPQAVVALLAGALGTLARADTYTVANEAELRQAVQTANADGAPISSIHLAADIAILDPAALTQASKPLVIDTGSHTLSGAPGVGSGRGGNLSFAGGPLTLNGTARGGTAAPTTSSSGAAGGVGFSMPTGSLTNNGAIVGGGGGANSGTGSRSGGSGGIGASLSNTSLVNNGSITGGAGGQVDVGGSQGGCCSVSAGNGATGLVLTGGSLDNVGTIAGGAGGNIVRPGSDNQFAGDGALAASLSSGSHINRGMIVGGASGVGRNAGSTAHGNGGGGVRLVDGALINASGASILGADGISGPGSGSPGGTGVDLSGSTLENAGAIAGGRGGGSAGGGRGVVGANVTLVNNGTISGGTNSSNVRANAIQFTSGTNALELRAGSIITGNVVAAGAGDILTLGGSAAANFNVAAIGSGAQYRNFGIYEKRGTGTWTLTGTTGTLTPWKLLGGTLSVSSDGNLGAASGALTFDGGILQVSGAGLGSTARGIQWGANGGGFDIADAGHIFTLGQTLSGGGPLVKRGAGTLTMTGDNTYVGGTTIEAGIVQLGNGGSSGSVSGDIRNNGVLAVNRSDSTLNLTGSISGGGSVRQFGNGIVTLSGDNSYTGGTTIEAGTLQLGDGGSSGSVVGSIANNGILSFNRSDSALHLTGDISGSGSVRQIGSGTVTLSGTNSYTGGTVVKAGRLQLGTSTALGTGTLSMADGTTLGFTAGDLNIANPLQFTGAGDPTIDTGSFSETLSGAISGAGSLTKTGSGTLILTNVGNTYTGPTLVEGGVLAVNGSIQSPTSVMPGGTLAGFGVINGTVQNFGTVWPGHAVAGDPTFGALTIRGDYASSGRGLLVLNTLLGGDGSPSSQLVIDGGTATGRTGVAVHNVGGTGARTHADGIEVVSAVNGGVTAPDAFALLGQLRGGAYSYRLYRGDLAGNEPDSWYLRNTFLVGPPLPPDRPDSGPLPVDPPPAVLPPGEYPIIGPALATYGVVQPVARQLGMLMLGTMHERVGDSALMAPAPQPAEHGTAPSVWGRTFARHVDNHYRAFADPHAQGWLAGLQLGLDVWRGVLIPGHSDRAGFYVGYGNASLSARGLVTNADATNYVQERTGSIDLNAWAGGAYWTHYGPTGWYAEAVLQGTGYDGSGRTDFTHLDINGAGFIGSLEAGYPVALPQLGPGFVLEPQVQLVWQRVALDRKEDDQGKVDLGTTKGTSGRLGIRGKWRVPRGNGQLWEPYVVGNLWHDWGARSTVVYSEVVGVPLEQAGSRLELGGGVTVTAKDRLSFYASTAYQFAVGSDRQRDSFKATVGLRKTW
ncbi:autotransporter outer membrane beta-barrel domain-containing protein [Variovorax sp. LARHSF232]